MDFELTITGLCLVALRRKEEDSDQPAEPLGIEIFCPQATNHRTVLIYEPEGVKSEFEPEMVVDETGKRLASLDLSNQVWTVSFNNGPGKFRASWGTPSGRVPTSSCEEEWLNWVPRLADIGLD